MGYHLRVLRGTAEPEISQQEFAAAVRATPSLVLDDDECSARFIRDGDLRSTIFLSDGEAWTNTAEEDVLEVMLLLAKSLKARVRGDNNESYRSVSETYIHPDDIEEVAEEKADYQRWKRRNLVWNTVRFSLLGIVLASMIIKALRD
jgi:hypothetical protein